MADVNRRKGGPTAARSHQSYLQSAAAANNTNAQNPQFQAYQQQQQQQQQQSPYQYQFQQQQMQFKQQQQAKMTGAPPAGTNRYTRDRAGPVRGGQQKSPVSAKMGIKSGMTVEDLKRLTQKRMQQGSSSAATPLTPKASVSPAPQDPHLGSRPSTPTINMAVVNAGAPAPVVPKTGMTVQELKQLTTLRLASQSVPLHQSEITGLVSKAVLTNVAKSHYRDSLRSSLTPSSTPKRGPAAAPSSSSSRANQPNIFNLTTPEVRGNRSRSRSSQLTKTVEKPNDAMQQRYSYSGGQTIDDYLAFDNDGSNSSQENDSYVRPTLDLDDDSRYPYDKPSHQSLQFPDDSFPPPPPMDENGGFVGNSLPSWSPPPTKAKRYDSGSSGSFYSQQTSYYNIASKEENAALDQNAVIAPPPGLSRRPSMTVPWQVAEAVLNTPQTGTNRKKLLSPGGGSGSKKTLSSEPESSNMFATKSSSRSNAAEAAAQLSAMSLQMGRQRSGTGGGNGTSMAAPAPGPPPVPTSTGPQPLAAGARRGSFGNAAEFFKFRRRSKSRLELARDLSGNFISEGEVIPGFPNYGTSGAGAMPGIDESRPDLQDNFSVMANADTVSDASSSSSDNGSSSQGYDDDEIVQITGGYDDPNEIAGNFVSFYHATGAGRSGRDNLSGLSNLSIPPPPPPPPLTDDEDASSTTSSSKGLPIMSPNGFRLRKVAELARRGSLSSEDKTRAKDEIIQSSLGIGASKAARIFSSKMGERPSSVTTSQPPPGFAVLSATPPRNTPKATMTKTLTPGAGIVRSNSISGAAPKLSPTTTSGGSRKVLSGGSESGESGSKGNNNRSSLEERLASAAQRVADCVGKGDMVGFQKAMEELDWLRNEANSLMRG